MEIKIYHVSEIELLTFYFTERKVYYRQIQERIYLSAAHNHIVTIQYSIWHFHL